MKKFVIPTIAAVLVLVAAAGGAYALTSDDDEPAQATRESAEDARCAAESPDCVDPKTVSDGDDGDAFGICIEGAVDCVDTPTNPDEPITNDPSAAGGTCLAGSPECNDTPADLPVGEPNGGSGSPGSTGCIDDADACREAIVLKILDDAATRTGAEAILISAEYVEWPDTSLGNPEPTAIYAQVITPGYLIIVESGGTQYEYHTDTTGNFTLLD